ncbi:hypothetical protein C8F01DRAFT_1362785 [Mycena amicta]|nr:hypothetical protein C8F01DRAFT_1362785 [Mycena amicta]
MSRRLDISSLLCNDDPPDRVVPETVILAPHLAVRKYASHPRPPPTADAQALDALAQAAALHRPYPVPRYDQPRRYWDTEATRPLTSPSVEPSLKKRRPSDLAMPMSLRHTGDRSILNPEPSPIFHRPSSSSSVLEPAPFGYRARVTEDRFGPPDTTPHFLPGRRSSPPPPDPILPQPTYTVIHLPERAQDDYVVPDTKRKKSHASRSSSISRPPRRPRQPKDEDAHDWLLGQLSDAPQSRPKSSSPTVEQTKKPLLPEPAQEQPVKMDIDSVPNDKMDIDVDDELLSLVDGPQSMSRVPSGSHKPPSRHPSPASSIPAPSERGSMPPPASTVVAKKKKDPPKPKPKAPAKPRAKPAPKPKPKPSEKAKPSAISRKSGSAAASASRSRSNSAMPGGSVGPDGSEKPDEEEDEPMPVAEDDKLYCICKTTYDEDRFMIACDKCDEWYHTQCVEMPDLVVDLVDQFFCPPCIAKNPHLSLKTTYKQRCRNGMEHPEPDSPKACHKPAQGALSKYCSPECGYNSMKARIDKYTKNGGKKELLWESVKSAQKREAVVIVHQDDDCTNGQRIKPSIGRVEREEANLNAVLDEVVAQREELRQGMDIIIWRERLLDLATEHAHQTEGQCGWDQRLLFGEDEWEECGEEVLESYDKEGEEWWCLESDNCERHAGWQTIRAREVAKEKENKEEALRRLTTRERELRKRVLDITEPFNRSCMVPATLKSSKLANGNKKGKKRKNPS